MQFFAKVLTSSTPKLRFGLTIALYRFFFEFLLLCVCFLLLWLAWILSLQPGKILPKTPEDNEYYLVKRCTGIVNGGV